MSLCVASAGIVKSLSVAAFMLSWVHSVEKTEWQEDWTVTPQGLAMTQARVKGSGAGMEPPADATLSDGWYRWTPRLAPLPQLVLGNSAVAGEWTLCINGRCQLLSDILGRPAIDVATISACDAKTLLERGDDFNAKGNFDAAIADYDAALNLDPVFVEALNGRGQAWRGKGDRRRALTDFELALKLQPDFEPARANRKSLALEIERLGAQMPLKARQH